MTTVLVSGGFDPLHDGHIELIELAYAHGEVIVAINSDDWLIRKKGYVFMPFEARRRILDAIYYVRCVIQVIDEDDTIVKTLEAIKPDFFVNGGDRLTPNPREDQVCKKLNVHQVFGGRKIRSSSELVRAVKQ